MNGPHRQGHYIHTVTYAYRERLVGAFVLSGVLGFLALIAINITSNHIFERKIVFHGYLDNVAGIDANTVVKIAGIPAGHVLSLGMTKNDKVRVTMFVYKRFQHSLRSDAVATLNRLSLLSAPTIDIAPGTNGAPMLAENAAIKMHATVSVNELMGDVANLLYSADTRPHKALIADLSETVANLKVITDRIREGKGAAGTLLSDPTFNRRMVHAVKSLNRVLAATSERLAQMAPLLAQSRTLVANLQTSGIAAQKLISEARDATGQARQTLTLLNAQMRQLPDFMTRTDLLLLNANDLVNAIETIWPVSSALPKPHDKGLISPQAAHG